MTTHDTHSIAGLVSHIGIPPHLSAAHHFSFEPKPVEVTFEGGETASLDPSDSRSVAFADILGDLHQAGIPGYVEVHPETRAITRLLIPIAAKVLALSKTASGDMEVVLEISHGHHVLRHSNSQFQKLLGLLEDAKKTGSSVLVTDTDDHEVIDVRPWQTVTKPHEAAAMEMAAAAFPGEAAELGGPLAGANAPAAGIILPTVTPQRAQQIFNYLASASCPPLTVPAPCIPFLYPDDGCWGRAHEMCHRIVTVFGNTPGKVWNYGSLHVKTNNNPNCVVYWGWHVAPVLAVVDWKEFAVIDPSMCLRPVPVSTWKQAQQDANSQIAYTAWQVFYRSKSGQVSYDPNFTQTAQVLATYRAALKARSLSVGPPPYAKCKVIPACA